MHVVTRRERALLRKLGATVDDFQRELDIAYSTPDEIYAARTQIQLPEGANKPRHLKQSGMGPAALRDLGLPDYGWYLKGWYDVRRGGKSHANCQLCNSHHFYTCIVGHPDEDIVFSIGKNCLSKVSVEILDAEGGVTAIDMVSWLAGTKSTESYQSSRHANAVNRAMMRLYTKNHLSRRVKAWSESWGLGKCAAQWADYKRREESAISTALERRSGFIRAVDKTRNGVYTAESIVQKAKEQRTLTEQHLKDAIQYRDRLLNVAITVQELLDRSEHPLTLEELATIPNVEAYERIAIKTGTPYIYIRIGNGTAYALFPNSRHAVLSGNPMAYVVGRPNNKPIRFLDRLQQQTKSMWDTNERKIEDLKMQGSVEDGRVDTAEAELSTANQVKDKAIELVNSCTQEIEIIKNRLRRYYRADNLPTWLRP